MKLFRKRSKAFSYIEVLTAMALFSFILTSLMSLHHLQSKALKIQSAEIKSETVLLSFEKSLRRAVSQPLCELTEDEVKVAGTNYLIEENKFIASSGLHKLVLADLTALGEDVSLHINQDGRLVEAQLRYGIKERTFRMLRDMP